jgi:N-acetylglucosamine-6-phosphate deacetylase
VLRFDEAVRLLISFTGCDLADASQAASGTPATLAGATDIGRLEVGCRADIVLLDDVLEVGATVVGGRVAWDPEQRWKS